MLETATDRATSTREDRIAWDRHSPLSRKLETNHGEIRVRHGRFVGGASDDVEVVEIDTGAVQVTVLPTRGMSIWKVESEGIRYAWQSPVCGPVHPARVPTFDPNGLGWLEGFDELVVRCGLESNGAPEHDSQGRLLYPLHGRIGNLAADSLSIEFDSDTGRLELIGEVIESRLFFKRLRLRSRLCVHAGSRHIELIDSVTNELSTSTTAQLLYHINIGSPVLQAGSSLQVPISELAPKDALSASEIEQWNQFAAPESGYGERVYFAKLLADQSQQTTAMICDADCARGFAIDFDVKSLPYFILWKNTAAESDGYVVGMEPATNFPNTRSFETEHGRVVHLAPGQTETFRVLLQPLVDKQSVQQTSEKIAAIATGFAEKGVAATVHSQPREGWSMP